MGDNDNPKKQRGRKTLLTPEVQKALIDALNVGATHEIACQYAGIGTTAFYDWMNKNANFAEAINNAQGKGAIRHLANINKLAQGDENNTPDWKASAWLLERRYPDQYGRRVIDANIKGELTIRTFNDVVNADDTDTTDEPFA